MAGDFRKGIQYFFQPKSIAVAGVSTEPTKIASIIFSNLQKNVERGSLKSSIYPVNPSYPRIGNLRCYPDIKSLPEPPELLIIAIPAALTQPIVSEAAKAGVKAVAIITGGFAEAGRRRLEARIAQSAKSHGMRILGPNTIGILDSYSGVDMLFLPASKKSASGKMVSSLVKPPKGSVVIITQSGHLGEVISERLTANRIGVRAIVGVGNQLDVSIEDIIDYFAHDDYTRVMVVYLEGVKDGRRFMRISSAAGRKKPIIALKVGKTTAGAAAALTHTASLVGDYSVYKAAFEQAGVFEASSIQELVDYCMSFSLLPPASGARLLIMTNAGGVGAIAADEAERVGLEVPQPQKETVERIRREFGRNNFIRIAVTSNPMDLTASSSTEEFVGVTELALNASDYDLAVLLPTHQTPTIDHRISSKLIEVLRKAHKPASICVIGHSELAELIQREFVESGVPSYPTPEAAVKTLGALVKSQQLRAKAFAPPEVSSKDKLTFLKRHRGRLPEDQVAKLLNTYHISQTESINVRSEAEIRKLRITFPAACKLLSSKLFHKTEAGGVILNVRDKQGLISAFRDLNRLSVKRHLPFDGVIIQRMIENGVEIILGGLRDKVFGPIILFGVGGVYTELLHDYATAVAPVSLEHARRMIQTTRMSPVLEGYRQGLRVNLGDLSSIVARFSSILVENPSISEIEINPLIATAEKIVAVDTRVLLS